MSLSYIHPEIKLLFQKYDKDKKGRLSIENFGLAILDLLNNVEFDYSYEEYKLIKQDGFYHFDKKKRGFIDLEDFSLMIAFFIEEKGYVLDV